MDGPEFCPNKECELHKKDIDVVNWYDKYGTYKTNTFGKVQRYKCRKCKKTFSEQTFSIDYYAKKTIDYEELLKKLISTSSNHDISRDFCISTATVCNKITRLARQAISIHEELKNEIVLNDDLTADGLESFTVSQYYPNNITFLILSSSQYIYYFNYTTIRRKGRMTEKQKIKREELEKQYLPCPKGLEIAFLQLLYEIESIKKTDNQIYLYTDEKKEYERALNRHIYGYRDLTHIRISSTVGRNHKNKLFSCNYTERQVRKDCSNHVRETVCFSRNVNNCMERMAVYVMHHNYIKLYRERLRGRHVITHAEMGGIPKPRIDKCLKDIFTKRRFLSLENISGTVEELWNKMLVTPLKNKQDYLPAYAVA